MGYSAVPQHSHFSPWSSGEYEHSRVANGIATGTAPRDISTSEIDEKTMGDSLATAPTHVSDLVGAHGEEDDATTIRSVESTTEIGHSGIVDELGGYEPTAPSRSTTAGGAEATSSCSVSTAPSTADEASLFGGVGGEWATYNSNKQQLTHHRVPSWEASPHTQHSLSGRTSPSAMHLPPSFSPNSGWSNGAQQQQHVASFRSDSHQGYPRPNHWNHQHSTPPRYGVGTMNDHSMNFYPARGTDSGARGMYHRANNVPTNGNFQYPQHQARKGYSHQQSHLPPSTPPRGAERVRNQNRVVQSTSQSPHRQQMNQHNGSGGGAGGANSRSSSEVLKTLLRKKACLYEPDTSRAVALVTWLVGRELALAYGFFSRQQLQAGVHSCVSDKIDSGVITRTKVNRCMQIILNSCFHYIIPRPDGTEENGESLRGAFATDMKNDSFLLGVLPAPWKNIKVDQKTILSATQEEMDVKNTRKSSPFITPHSSPRLSGMHPDKGSPGKESVDGDGSEAKRAVLLCFNENVRSAEDVFRCHNEFIRDTAHACHLQLSSNEWRLFFGREAASAPHLWGNVGIPVPYRDGQGPAQTDALGVMSKEEVSAFRTTWCSKRYDHDHELCGFAHPEINGGWLRRLTSVHNYKDEMCQFVKATSLNTDSSPRCVLIVNECPKGIDCEFAHSPEEILYHPRRYKQCICPSVGRGNGCSMSDICPDFHPADSYRFLKKSETRSPRHTRQSSHHGGGNKALQPGSLVIPVGSPIMYASPAPVSNFERHLLMPGLQNLYRRNCAVVRSNLRSDDGKICMYSYFGDDTGVSEQRDKRSARKQANVIGPPYHQIRI